MATRKRTSRRDEDREREGRDGYEFDQAELDFLDFMEAIDHSVSVVEILQMNKDGSRPHVDRVTIDVIREDVYGYLRSAWGPGKYLLIFKNAQRRIMSNRVVEVGGKPPSTTSNNGAPGSYEQFLREQQAQQQTLILALIGAMKPPAPMDLSFLANVLKPPDTAGMFTAIAAAVGSLKPKQDNEDWLGKARTIIELAQDLRPDQGKDDNPWTVAREVGGRLIEAVAGAAAQAPGAPARLPAYTGNPPAEPPAENGAKPLSPAETRAHLTQALTFLKSKAVAGSDPELYVDFTLDNETALPWGVVSGAVGQGATFEQLLQFDREIAENPQLLAWFQKFYDGLHAEIFNNVDSARQAGDPGNPGGNGAPGASAPGGPGHTQPG